MTTNCNHNALGNRVYDFFFNPFEIAICGPSYTCRAQLAAMVEAILAPSHSVGQVMARDAAVPDSVDPIGVNLVRGDGQHGLLYPEGLDDYLRPRPLIDVDIVLVESEADTPLPKLVRVEDGVPPVYDHVLAYIGSGRSCPVLPPSAAYFRDDQSALLRRHIDAHLDALVAQTPVYGLVLTGGKSERMGSDKGAIEYHGQTQAARCIELLRPHCDEVFVSLRAEQAGDAAYRAYPQIHDRFLGFGPMGGILSAQKAHPQAAWLVLACDLPFVDAETLESLVSRRNPFKLATAYVSAHDGFPEPLCAVYEPKSIFRLTQFLALGYHCPRKVLINSDTWLLELPEARALDNANTPDERAAALDALSPGAARR